MPAKMELFSTIEGLQQMRINRDAPVDHMIQEIPGFTPKQRRLHELIALLLSSQTTDKVTMAAMARLRAEDFCAEGLVQLSEAQIQQLIYPVGFYRRKAVQLKACLQILIEQYDGDVPYEFSDMLALPGIGPKMAFLLRAGAWKEIDGIGVDTHVHRLSQLWKWVPPSKYPEKIRVALEAIVPRELWYELNVLIVGFGQTICPARGPKCDECLFIKKCAGAKPSLKRKKRDPAAAKLKLEYAPEVKTEVQQAGATGNPMDDINIASLESFVDSYVDAPRVGAPAPAVGSGCRLTLTWAQSLDARISAGRGLRTKLSGSESHKMTHYLRTKHDAILVGWKTVEADNPKLNCRYPGFAGQLRPIILDTGLNWKANEGEWAVLENARAQTGLAPWVLTATDPSTSPATAAIEQAGGLVLRLPDLEWPTILDYLASCSISSVMVEGGARIICSALQSALTHCIIVTVAPVFLGEAGVEVSPLSRLDLESVSWWSQSGCQDTVLAARQGQGQGPAVKTEPQ